MGRYVSLSIVDQDNSFRLYRDVSLLIILLAVTSAVIVLGFANPNEDIFSLPSLSLGQASRLQSHKSGATSHLAAKFLIFHLSPIAMALCPHTQARAARVLSRWHHTYGRRSPWVGGLFMGSALSSRGDERSYLLRSPSPTSTRSATSSAAFRCRSTTSTSPSAQAMR